MSAMDAACCNDVSICALARRATPHVPVAATVALGFNLRPRTEGDEHDQPAPAVLFGFNLRPRTEGDTPGSGQAAEYYLFQSAPSHGGRPV